MYHWLPAPLGARLLRDAVLGLCPLLRVDILQSLWVLAHPLNGVSLPLLGIRIAALGWEFLFRCILCQSPLRRQARK